MLLTSLSFGKILSLQLHDFISVNGGLSESELPSLHPEITNESSARLSSKPEIKMASERVQIKEVLLIKIQNGTGRSLTEKWQKYRIIIGHHKQVDAVQSSAGL